MVNRPNTDSSPHARITRISQRHDELARAVSRGSTALRDADANILGLAGGALPLLATPEVDAALAFPRDNSLAVMSADGADYRPFAAGDTTVHGNHTVTGGAVVDGVLTSGQHNMGTSPIFCGAIHCTTIDGTANFGTTGVVASGPNFIAPTQLVMNAWPIFCGDVNAININYSGALTHVSDARLKEQFCPVDDDLLDRLLETPVQRWRWKARREWDEASRQWLDRTPDQREHIHPVAQDMPHELTVEMRDGHLGVDPASTVGALLALVQRQQGQIDALTERVNRLEGTPASDASS